MSYPYYRLAKEIERRRESDVAPTPPFHALYGAVMWYATACEGQGGFSRDDQRVVGAGRLLRPAEKDMVKDVVREEWARRDAIRT